MQIAPCPCCCGTAKVFIVIIESIKMCQVGCITCGLTTDYDMNKVSLLKKWNTRKQLENHKKKFSVLLIIMLIVGIMIFFSGYFVALKSLLPIY